MNRLCVFFFITIGLFLTFTAVATTSNKVVENLRFSSNLLKFTNLEDQITKQKNSYLTLTRLQSQLVEMNKKAITCVSDANKQIEKILGYLSTDLNTTINEYNTFLIQEKIS